jgi:hypothetical protein
LSDCYSKCPIECSFVKYDLTFSSSTFPTEWYTQVLNNNAYFIQLINLNLNMSPLFNYTDNYAGLKNSLSSVNVFYHDLRYVQIDDTIAVTVVALLGTLGGNLGLFLGEFNFILQ